MPEVLQAHMVLHTTLRNLHVITGASSTNQLRSAVTHLHLHRTWVRNVSRNSFNGDEKLMREAALTPIVVQDKTKEGAGKKSGKPTRKSGSYRAPSVEERVERIVATATSPKPRMSSSHPFEAIELKMTRARIFNVRSVLS